jgi:hypothetical protein
MTLHLQNEYKNFLHAFLMVFRRSFFKTNVYLLAENYILVPSINIFFREISPQSARVRLSCEKHSFANGAKRKLRKRAISLRAIFYTKQRCHASSLVRHLHHKLFWSVFLQFSKNNIDISLLIDNNFFGIWCIYRIVLDSWKFILKTSMNPHCMGGKSVKDGTHIMGVFSWKFF